MAYNSGGFDADWIAAGDVNGDGKPDVLGQMADELERIVRLLC